MKLLLYNYIFSLISKSGHTTLSNQNTDFSFHITYAKVSQKFCIILVHANLWSVDHITKTVQAIEGTCNSW